MRYPQFGPRYLNTETLVSDNSVMRDTMKLISIRLGALCWLPSRLPVTCWLASHPSGGTLRARGGEGALTRAAARHRVTTKFPGFSANFDLRHHCRKPNFNKTDITRNNRWEQTTTKNRLEQHMTNISISWTLSKNSKKPKKSDDNKNKKIETLSMSW